MMKKTAQNGRGPQIFWKSVGTEMEMMNTWKLYLDVFVEFFKYIRAFPLDSYANSLSVQALFKRNFVMFISWQHR